jgi:hypothetical protein
MMNTTESYQERYQRAKERVEEIRAFYTHAFIYVLVNVGLAGLNYYQNEWRFMWFLFPLAGWGMGLVGHAIGTFGYNPFTGKDWEERKIKELMEKEQQKGI